MTKFSQWPLDIGFFIRRPPSKTTTFEWSQEQSSYTGLTVITFDATCGVYSTI